MGNQKHKWTADEEAALLAGIKKHGLGKWSSKIPNLPAFSLTVPISILRINGEI
ncbi:hypothetical protein QN277_022338 [Acacia crassicarpa]|uniref:HTH myb-type domain-containing protein n=1 Tax=Acacia crassicarpa TaxID=499986 RepID=A0AAE1JJG2_9FABA|nr:hypothetical protein QN277_022338 [Acacia crassicarpa]